MRKTTIAWLCLSVVCGALLFRTSQMTTDGNTRLSELDAATQKEKESIRVLAAEWGYLNQPDRLEKMAREHLALEPMKGSQFSKVESLELLPEGATIAPDGKVTEPAKEEKVAEEPKAAAPAPEAPPVVAEKPVPEVKILTAEKEAPAASSTLAPRKTAEAKPKAAPKRGFTAYNLKQPYPRYVPPKGAAYSPPRAPAYVPPKAPAYTPPGVPAYTPPRAIPPPVQKKGFGDLMKNLGVN